MTTTAALIAELDLAPGFSTETEPYLCDTHYIIRPDGHSMIIGPDEEQSDCYRFMLCDADTVDYEHGLSTTPAAARDALAAFTATA